MSKKPSQLFLRDSFSLWILPPGEKRRVFSLRVSRLQASAFSVLIISALLLSLPSGKTFISRVSGRLIASYEGVIRSLQKSKLSQERDTLLAEKEALLEELAAHRLSTSEPVDTSVAQSPDLKARLRELASLIDLAAGYGFFPSQKSSLSTDRQAEHQRMVGRGKFAEGIGGLELKCRRGDRRCEAEYAASEKTLGAFVGRTDSMMEGFFSESRRELRQELMNSQQQGPQERLDQYLEILRSIPLGSPGQGFVVSAFGFRRSPFLRGYRMHQGVDFGLPYGSTVESTADGVVDQVRWDGTYGLMIDVLHSNRVSTRYAHLSRASVRAGEKVCRGQELGFVGTSGRSTGPHLHYEVRVAGKALDPAKLARLSVILSDSFHG